MAPQKPALALVAIPPQEYEAYADGLQEFLPHSYQIEGMLRAHCAFHHMTFINSTLYAPSDPQLRYKMSVITPVCSLRDIRNLSLYWSDAHLTDDMVYHLLLSLPFTGWHLPCTIRQMPFHLQHAMNKILYKLSGGVLSRVTPIPCFALVLSPEDTPSVPKLPEGYYFKKLDGTYGAEVLSYWTPNFSETTSCMSFFLETLPNVGIFYRKKSVSESEENLGTNVNELTDRNDLARRSNVENVAHDSGLTNAPTSGGQQHRIEEKEDSRDELASYVVLKHGADTGMTFTHEKHRRRGLGRAITIYIAHELHALGIRVTVNVAYSRGVSLSMHKKMGFKYLTETSFPMYLPKKFDFESVPRLPDFIESFSDSPDSWFDLSDEE